MKDSDAKQTITCMECGKEESFEDYCLSYRFSGNMSLVNAAYVYLEKKKFIIETCLEDSLRRMQNNETYS